MCCKENSGKLEDGISEIFNGGELKCLKVRDRKEGNEGKGREGTEPKRGNRE